MRCLPAVSLCALVLLSASTNARQSREWWPGATYLASRQASISLSVTRRSFVSTFSVAPWPVTMRSSLEGEIGVQWKESKAEKR